MHSNVVVEFFMILHALGITVVISVIFCIDFIAITSKTTLVHIL